MQRHSEARRGPPRHAVFTAPRPLRIARLSTLSLTSAPPTSSLTPPPLLDAAYHAQYRRLPLHWAAQNSSSVAVVQALLAANPEAAMATDNVRGL